MKVKVINMDSLTRCMYHQFGICVDDYDVFYTEDELQKLIHQAFNLACIETDERGED